MWKVMLFKLFGWGVVLVGTIVCSYCIGYVLGNNDAKLEHLEMRMKIGAIFLRDLELGEWDLLRGGILTLLSGDFESFVDLSGGDEFRLGYSKERDREQFEWIRDRLSENGLLAEQLRARAEYERNQPGYIPPKIVRPGKFDENVE